MKYAKQRTPTRYATRNIARSEGSEWSLSVRSDGSLEYIGEHQIADAFPYLAILENMRLHSPSANG